MGSMICFSFISGPAPGFGTATMMMGSLMRGVRSLGIASMEATPTRHAMSAAMMTSLGFSIALSLICIILLSVFSRFNVY